jgi:chorismate mutase
MAEERDLKPAAKPGGESDRATTPAPPGPGGMAEIEAWRRRIDSIDDQLMGLLNSRSACAVEIGKIKRVLGLPVYSPEREAWILERLMRENPGPLDALAVRRVFERIIDEGRRLERLGADRRGAPPREDGPAAGDGQGGKGPERPD